MDNQRVPLVLFNRGEQCTTVTGIFRVACLCFAVKEDSAAAMKVLFTAALHEVKFWWSEGQNVKSQRGLWKAGGGRDRELAPSTPRSSASNQGGHSSSEIVLCVASAS